MSKIPTHVRNNHEKTSLCLHQIRGMMLALDHMAEAVNPPVTPQSESLFILIAALHRMVQEAKNLHSAEWVGYGGSSDRLSDDEKAAARGESKAEKVAA